jgi:hypothetical protein
VGGGGLGGGEEVGEGLGRGGGCVGRGGIALGDGAGGSAAGTDGTVEGDGLGVGQTGGAGNRSTRIPDVALAMKSCQISAGIEPPNTSAKPSTPCMGTFPRGWPTHTHVASWGVYPQNHAFV